MSDLSPYLSSNKTLTSGVTLEELTYTVVPGVEANFLSLLIRKMETRKLSVKNKAMGSVIFCQKSIRKPMN